MSRTNPRFVEGTATEHDRPGAVGGPAGGRGRDSALTRRRISQVVLYTLLIVGALIALLPMMWMLSASFMPTGGPSSAARRGFVGAGIPRKP